jgi:hypothetical protein
MRRRTRQGLKKKARRHGLFIAVVVVLVAAIGLGLLLAPHTENGESWHLPQVGSG